MDLEKDNIDKKSLMNNINSIINIPYDFKVKSYDISNRSAKLPLKSIVWELNHISPILTGYFFENIIANILKTDINLCNLECCL